MSSLLMEQKGRKQALVLVVEDEPIIRDFVCEILTEEGYDTYSSESADKAKLFLEENAQSVALLLTDILMPGKMNGADLSNWFGDHWPQIPILVMSGHETPESSGVKHKVKFVRKPWSIGQILDGVAAALGLEEQRKNQADDQAQAALTR